MFQVTSIPKIYLIYDSRLMLQHDSIICITLLYFAIIFLFIFLFF